ncbi:MASE3 domain-containing protein [Desulfovibrio ferrophilus]|uniref:histidine kinase n=1 Tax=Desulfovibrio ferrophilus TaxID=241368 RepID=A0A2Z6B122_9BACT|nr:MASE3 domain-containing protein [Desulfovibrio ferrophilus]BBD09155.1 multi-sensor signal transduction histidine kinase [Desulfovibrio ferrophilus]
MKKVLYVFDSWLEVAAGLFITVVLVLFSSYNFLLFHTLSELFSVVVAFSMFVLAYSSRERIQSGYLILLGAAYFHIATIDLLHTLAFKGMGVFPGHDANLPTQLWIAGRYLEGCALLVAGLLASRRINLTAAFWGYALLGMGLIAGIFMGYFPDCYVDGQGLTPFKRISEIAICVLFLLALLTLGRARAVIGRAAYWLISLSIVFSVGAELLFTFYVSVYDLSLIVGHFAKVGSFYLIFKAVVEAGYARPQDVLFRKLNSSREELQAAQGLARFGSWHENLETGETGWSDELYRLLGYSPREMAPSGRLIERHIHPDDLPSLQADMDKALVEKSMFDREVRYSTTSGQARHARVMGRVLDLGNGPERLDGSFQDITDRKQAEQLRADVDSITRHDLRTPLSSIISYAELLHDEQDLNEEQRDMVARIAGNGFKMLDLLNRSLDLYRMEQGTFEMSARPVNLSLVMERVMEDLAEKAKRRQVAFMLEEYPSEGSGRIRGDDLLCYTLFANLVQNAVEASPQRGEVRIRLENNGQARATVWNDGVVPESVREHFFDKYVTSGKPKGTGLGTYSARLIAQVHGGDIGFSTSEDEGTAVWVTLPKS